MRAQFPELVYKFDYKIAVLDENYFVAYWDSEKEAGEVNLFIHGLMSYIPAWGKVIPELSKIHRCIAIDLPGYGKSSGGLNPGTVSFFVDIVVKFIQRMNLGKVNLVGHSMGGQIAIATTQKYPELVKNLILLAPAGFETFTVLEGIVLGKFAAPTILHEATAEQIKKGWANNFHILPDEISDMLKDSIEMKNWSGFKDYAEVVFRSAVGMLREPVFESLNKIECRTLIFFGINDGLIPNPYIHKDATPEEIARKGHNEINNSELILIDQCGHFIQYEKPDVVIKGIGEFVLKDRE